MEPIMEKPLVAAPVLSTPETRVAEDATSTVAKPITESDAQLETVYEVKRTAGEIRRGRWQRVALQFPDDLLPDAPQVYRRLQERLRKKNGASDTSLDKGPVSEETQPSTSKDDFLPVTLFILGDTSYSACCIDEIAAEHVDADVVVHYGRACLSPPARLPAIYVFTVQRLDHDAVLKSFQQTYSDKSTTILLAADMPYASHLPTLTQRLHKNGYEHVFETEIRHDPSSLIPNRTVPQSAHNDPEELRSWSLFHISHPPQALLLTLASRVSSIYIFSTQNDPTKSHDTTQAATAQALRRRYALMMQLSRASIIGVLVNTLSVNKYQTALDGIQARILAAGKKPYVFAMGRLNAAKVANFAEVDGWVLLGCWESSLVENVEFDKPIVAPYELELALLHDNERIWTGEWTGDFSNMTTPLSPTKDIANEATSETEQNHHGNGAHATDSDSESEPPEFDFRTGKYIMPSRPMGVKPTSNLSNDGGTGGSHSLVTRAKGDLAVIGGEVSPGAQFLRDKRTWRGLGSDFEIAYEDDLDKGSTAIKEGRSGIARGYVNEKSQD